MIGHEPTIRHAYDRMRAWELSEPWQYESFMRTVESGALSMMPSSRLAAAVGTIMRGDVKVEAHFAAFLVFALQELERRGSVAA